MAGREVAVTRRRLAPIVVAQAIVDARQRADRVGRRRGDGAATARRGRARARARVALVYGAGAGTGREGVGLAAGIVPRRGAALGQ